MKDLFSSAAVNFRLLFESAPGLYLVLTPDLRIAAASDAYLAATLTVREQILGRSVFDAFPDNPAEPEATGVRNLRASLEKVLRSKRADEMPVQKYDVRHAPHDNGAFVEKYWRPLNLPVLDANGELRFIIHRVEDVTERISAERREAEQKQISADWRREAQTARARLDDILASVTDAFYRFDADFRYIYVNRATTEMFGIAEKEFLGKTLWDCFPDAPGNDFHREIRRALANQETRVFENYYPPLDRWFENRVYPAPDGLSVFTTEITERKRAEKNLQLSEEKYRSLFDSIDEGFCVIEMIFDREEKPVDYRFLEINPSFARQSGIENAVGKTMCELYPQHEKYWFELYGKVALTGEAVRFENHAEQLGRWFDVYAFRYGRAEDRQVAVIFSDITERKQTEIKLREVEERFRLLTENAEDYAIIFLDTEARITNWNVGAQRIMGWTEREAVGQLGHLIFTPEDRADKVPEEELTGAAATGYARDERWHLRKDGSRFYAFGEMIALYTDDGHLRGFAKLFRDLTERRRADEKLRASEERFRGLQQATPDGFMIFESVRDAENKIVDFCWLYVNPAAEKIVGRAESDLIGKRLLEEMPGNRDEGLFDAYVGVVESGAVWQREFHYKHENLDHFFLNTAVRVGDGFAVSFSDITARKRAERERELLLESEQEARRQAESANRLKDEFLATVSHELRTPLNAILGWATMVRQQSFETNVMRRAFEVIERNARHQNQIISDILDVSRIITGKLNLNLEPLQLAPIIEAAIDTVRPAIDAKRIRLVTDLAPNVPQITGDADRLQQIVWNLLSNAVKFTPDDGTIEIRLDAPDDHAEIVIKDNGSGIEPEFLPFVFDRFRQADAKTNRKHGGLGLGLAIVRHLVELHGGSVRVESEGAGRGATLSVRLPLKQRRIESSEAENADFESATAASDRASARRLAGLSILIVDDQPDALELVAFILSGQGAQVATADSVDEALALFDREKFDLLISDIGMPEKDGFALIREVRERTNERFPMVALTAYAGEDDNRRVLEAGFQAYLPKPIEPTVLIEKIIELTARV